MLPEQLQSTNSSPSESANTRATRSSVPDTSPKPNVFQRPSIQIPPTLPLVQQGVDGSGNITPRKNVCSPFYESHAIQNNAHQVIPPVCPSRQLIENILKQFRSHSTKAWPQLLYQVAEELVPFTSLKLGGFNLGNSSARIIGHLLRLNRTLKIVDLGFNRISDKGIVEIARGLESNCTLESLYLSGNEITKEGAKMIAKALKRNRSLRRLYLSGNEIGPEGAIALAEMLETNTTLEVIFLGTNCIGDRGVEALARVVAQNQQLKEIALGQNEITGKGFVAFVQAFKSRQVPIKMLEVGKNNIDSVAVVALVEALCTHENKLEILSLDHNPIGDAGVTACAALIARSQTIQKIDLSYTKMSLLGLREISKGVARCPSLTCLLLDGHDWSSTKNMKNQVPGISGLPRESANAFAANCIFSAITFNKNSALVKLSGVNLAFAKAVREDKFDVLKNVPKHTNVRLTNDLILENIQSQRADFDVEMTKETKKTSEVSQANWSTACAKKKIYEEKPAKNSSHTFCATNHIQTPMNSMIPAASRSMLGYRSGSLRNLSDLASSISSKNPRKVMMRLHSDCSEEISAKRRKL